MNGFEQALAANDGVLIADGAMGTQLFQVGLTSGDSPELWNIEHPDRVIGIHEAYISAGADVVLTNSFGGSSFRLKLHDLDRRVHEVNKAAARNARSAVEHSGREVLVAGSMGPTGELLEPMGAMTLEGAAAAFAEQASGLVEGEVDLLWLETLSDLGEVRAAVHGVREVTDLPLVATLSFDTAGRTMMGVTAAAAATELAPLGLAAIGANCGNNLADTEAAIAEIRAADPDVVIISKANAGIPVWAGDALTYSGTPEVMGAHAHRAHSLGAQIIGACCGSSASHIQLMRQIVRGEIPCPQVEAPEDPSSRSDPESRRTRRTRRRRG